MATFTSTQTGRELEWCNGTDAPDYVQVTGRELYEAASITGLNRIPILLLEGFILSGATTTSEPPIPLTQLNEGLLVDGSVLLVNDIQQTNIVWSSSDQVRQEITGRVANNTATEKITRVWLRLESSDWLVTDWTNFGNVQAAQVSDPVTIPGGQVNYYWNAADPEGILYRPQNTYHRLEEIERTIRRFQSGPGAKTLIFGHIRNLDDASRQLNSDDPSAVIAGDIRVDRITSTSAIDQLMSESNMLQPMWYQQTHVVDTTSPVQRPSGADRKLVLAPMFRFIEQTRRQLTELLDQFWGISWSTERLHTTDTQERLVEFQLLKEMRDLGVLPDDEFKELSKKLT
jgi:hypothetical protein